MDNLETIKTKVRKLLALSRSDNENEAGAYARAAASGIRRGASPGGVVLI